MEVKHGNLARAQTRTRALSRSEGQLFFRRPTGRSCSQLRPGDSWTNQAPCSPKDRRNKTARACGTKDGVTLSFSHYLFCRCADVLGRNETGGDARRPCGDAASPTPVKPPWNFAGPFAKKKSGALDVVFNAGTSDRAESQDKNILNKTIPKAPELGCEQMRRIWATFQGRRISSPSPTWPPLVNNSCHQVAQVRPPSVAQASLILSHLGS